MMTPNEEPDYKRIMVAIFLSAVLLLAWQVTVEWPRRIQLAEYQQQVQKQETEKKALRADANPLPTDRSSQQDVYDPNLTIEERLALSPRVKIQTPKLIGSLALKGARFDDLSFVQYREAVEADSPPVRFFSPNGDEKGYFAHIGWVAQSQGITTPDQNTLWKADKTKIGVNDPLTLSWDNGQGITYQLIITLDQHYMFTIEQKVTNSTAADVQLMPYGYINRTYTLPEKVPFLHEGPIGVMNETLNEVDYKTLQEDGLSEYPNAKGWFGVSDHFWLSALIPAGDDHKVSYRHYTKNNHDRYQVDYLDDAEHIAPQATRSTKVRLFAGAKELTLLDYYADGDGGDKPIPLLDRSLDFGVFYFLAKPACLITYYLFKATGNFGVALIIFIIFLKIALYPLANKSYKSMAQMRELQPEMMKIREKYFDDQIAMHKNMRELYKREKVNPASGCLPILLQLVIFLALFRGLNVMIEMRHAPFYGYLHDLSAADPSNIFTLFGLVEWPHPDFLHLGLLPILYCITMVVQTRLQPKPPDPVQAKMITYMPYFMLIIFASMPSGFVLYWTWSNILSIIQQQLITKKYKQDHSKKGGNKTAAPANG